MSSTNTTRVEVLIPFAEPNIQPFRKGEIFSCPTEKAKEFLAGGLVRLATETKPLEKAVALPFKK